MNDERQRGTCGRSAAQRGIALIAVLMALTLLMLLAVPFAVGMSIGLDAATTTADVRTAELGSASVRDLLLGEVALGHPALDPTPLHDSADEYPATLGVPEQMQALREDGRVLLAGEVWDLQRKIELNGVSPLLLANLLGTTARLGQTLAPLASSIQLRDGGNLPDDGYVWIDHELIHYGKRQGNVLSDLKRSQLVTEQGFAKETDHTVKEDALVLDYRCVVAATWPFDGRTLGQRRERKPYTAVGELAEIGRFGFGGFSAHELEVLANALVVGSGHETAPTWGRPERVFNTLPTGERLLRVKSSLHVGPGSTVRVRDVQNGNTEYGLVMTAATVQVPTDLLLPSEFHLRLLLPVTQDFPATDTVVEPLVPSPLNVNTADATTLAAAFAGIRRAQDVRDHGADGRQQQVPQPAISTTEARELAEQIVTLRGSGQDSAPFTGWQDLCERLWKPRFDDAKDLPQKQRWILLYRNLQTGRDAVLEMGTVPLCFCSGPWVGYRAAASVQRTAFAPGVAARHERTGVAVALPGLPLESEWPNQAALEETFRLDQRAPYWLTLPVNTGAVATDELGNNPAGRYF
ncbi:MAG TPA: hypothetical protein VK348_08495, partial [Planctomycetota bacterium]|nr:hypothetical protein [Planctomycetota bacterium]